MKSTSTRINLSPGSNKENFTGFHSGEGYDLSSPAGTIHLEDLYQGLTTIRRYNGQMDVTIMQHLAYCAAYSTATEPKNHRLAAYAAAHDLHEAYVGDMNYHLKAQCPGFVRIEEMWENYVHDQMGLPLAHRPSEQVRMIDMRALVVECAAHEHPALESVLTSGLAYPSAMETDLYAQVEAWSQQEQWGYVLNAIEGWEPPLG